jgi:hypothetical protein
MKRLQKMIDRMLQYILLNGLQSVQQLEQILKSYDGYDWHRYTRFRPEECYRNILYQDAQFKVILNCWGAYSEMQKQTCQDGECIIKFLYGRVQSLRYNALAPHNLIETNNYCKGDIAYMNDSFTHYIVKNLSSNVAVSIDIYSKGKVFSSQSLEENLLVLTKELLNS